MPNDKTPPIPLHETWPVVPGPSPPRPEDREPRTRALSDRGARTHVLLIALPRHSWDWLVLFGPRSVDQLQGLLRPIATTEPQDHGPAPPCHRATRLGPRAFRISVVNSLSWSFVCRHIYSRTNFKLNRSAAFFEWRQLLSA